MILNGIDKELILSLICGGRVQAMDEPDAAAPLPEEATVEAEFYSGATTYAMMDELNTRGIDVSLVHRAIADLWSKGDYITVYLLLLMCYMVSEVDMPLRGIPSLGSPEAVLSTAYSGYQHVLEYIEDHPPESASGNAESAGNVALQPERA